MSDREKVAVAFRALRRSGILARMNFSCCGSCGHYELAELAKASVKPVRGFVFYHAQAADSFKRAGSIKPSLWLQWEGDMAVAKDIAAALTAAGLFAVVPPDTATCVLVFSTRPKTTWPARDVVALTRFRS